MTVDTRYQPRIDLDIEVEIIYRKRCIQTRSRNVSSGGMFLATAGMTIPPGTFIGMEFTIGEKPWQIDGLVIRQNEIGIVCLFRMPQPELHKSAGNYRKSLENKAPARLKRPNPTQPNAHLARSTAES